MFADDDTALATMARLIAALLLACAWRSRPLPAMTPPLALGDGPTA